MRALALASLCPALLQSDHNRHRWRADRDLRPAPGSPALDGGIALRADGTVDPGGGPSSIGDFGPDARWVEIAAP